MTAGDLFDANAEDTEAALMAATYHALCEYGYADLTIQKIGEEFEKSPSLVYHHYDGKDDLLVAFLHYLLDRFEEDVPVGVDGEGDPWERLRGLLDHVLAPTLDPERRAFTAATIELRMQAVHDPDYRRAFTRHDEFFQERLTDLVAEGVESGQFREVDPAAVAALVQTTFLGAMGQRVTTDAEFASESIDRVREELEAMLERRLRSDDSPEADR